MNASGARAWAAALCLGLLSILSACGGGGGGSSTSISVEPDFLTFEKAMDQLVTTNAKVIFRGDGVVVGSPPNVSFPAWLSVSAADSTADSATFIISASTYGMTPGTYRTTLRFATGRLPPGGALEDATDISYDDVQVTLTVINFQASPYYTLVELPQGRTTLAESSFELLSDPGRHWTAVASQPWLKVVTAGGTGAATIHYAIDVSGLDPGVYNSSILVADDRSSATQFSVNLTVSRVELTTTPGELVFNIGSDTSPAVRTHALTISDQLDGQVSAQALSWSVGSPGVDWITVSPSSGTSAPPAQVTVTVPSAVLATMPNGSYQANIELAYSSGAGTYAYHLPVTLNLNAPITDISLDSDRGDPPIAQGIARHFSALATYASGYQQNLTQQLTWSSSNARVASVNDVGSDKGTVQPLLPGTATITATDPASSVSDSATLEIQAAAVIAYVTDMGDGYGGAIMQYLATGDGHLQPMAQSKIPLTGTPLSMLLSKDGHNAYVTSGNDVSPGQRGIFQFGIDAAGALNPLAPPTAGIGIYAPQAFTFDSSGQHIYVAGCCEFNGYII
ncbi:MAG: BACON domain-containing protein, partial [Solimonas sp.]